MSSSFKHVEQVEGLIAEAAFDDSIWPRVLEGISTLTHSIGAQLVGWDGHGTVAAQFHGIDPALQAPWVALGGDQPTNVVVSSGLAMQAGTTVAEHEILSEDERRRSPLWQDFYEAKNIPHLRQGKLLRDGSCHLMLTVFQDRRRGPLDTIDRVVFQRLVDASVRAAQTVYRLGGDRAHLLAGAFDLVDRPIFVLDGFCRVTAASARAEAMLRQPSPLRLSSNRLSGSNGSITRNLDNHLRRVAAGLVQTASINLPSEPAHRVMGTVCRLQISRLPSSVHQLPVGAAMIVIVHEEQLMSALSPVEGEVAQLLISGLKAAEIAERRGVSRETVRSQSKAIYAKLGVSGQLELIGQSNRVPCNSQTDRLPYRRESQPGVLSGIGRGRPTPTR